MVGMCLHTSSEFQVAGKEGFPGVDARLLYKLPNRTGLSIIVKPKFHYRAWGVLEFYIR